MTEATRDRRAALTVALCFLASIVEGLDNVSMGLAAPKLAPELGLAPSQVGMALSASLVGLMLGSLFGGRIADYLGRKAVLLGSVTALGVFSLATAIAPSFQLLLPIRFLVGLGLGGAFPMLIAFGAEAMPEKWRATGISLIYAGNPLGAALISLIVSLGGAGMGWRTIFHIGGIAPLVVAALLLVFLPEPADFRAAKAARADARPGSVGRVLFGERAAVTVLLWASFLFTMFVLYLMLNWIPSLMVAKGLSRPEGAMVSMALNLGSTFGVVTFGAAVDRGYRTQIIIPAYIALAISLVGLAYLQGYPLMLLCGSLVGFFMLGCQLVLYALSADCYPTLNRGTGVGAAIGIGRIGSVSAPLAAGAILNAGFGAAVVLGAAVPCVVLAAACTLGLILKRAAVVEAAA